MGYLFLRLSNYNKEKRFCIYLKRTHVDLGSKLLKQWPNWKKKIFRKEKKKKTEKDSKNWLFLSLIMT